MNKTERDDNDHAVLYTMIIDDFNDLDWYVFCPTPLT